MVTRWFWWLLAFIIPTVMCSTLLLIFGVGLLSIPYSFTVGLAFVAALWVLQLWEENKIRVNMAKIISFLVAAMVFGFLSKSHWGMSPFTEILLKIGLSAINAGLVFGAIWLGKVILTGKITGIVRKFQSTNVFKHKKSA